MAITINTPELIKVLEITPSNHNIMLVGKHGIGKSEILSSYFQAAGMKVVTLFLGQMSDPGDLIGLPNKDEKTGKTEFMPPYWFPMDGKPIVLFLDELNRARPEVLQTVMDLVLNRKLAGRTLPEGSKIISAVNDGEEYQLTDLDPALVSRFNIYTFRPTAQDWLLWAEKKGLDRRVISFIMDNPNLLDSDGINQIDRGLEKTPDRRAWKRVSDIIKGSNTLTEFHQKLVAGIVGVSVAAKFFKEFKNSNTLSAKDVLLNYSKFQQKIEGLPIDKISVINEDLLRYLETNKKGVKDEAKIISNLEQYILFLSSERKEGVAHLANCIVSKNYPKAMTFIVTKLPQLYTAIAKYIRSV